MKWDYQVSAGISSYPTVGNDGTIYFGANTDTLYALNSNGTLRWKYAADDYVNKSQAIVPDGTIYCCVNKKKIHAVNPDGTAKWISTSEGYPTTAPVVSNEGVIYIGFQDSGYGISAINPADGASLWSYRVSDVLNVVPAIDIEGNIYVGSNDDNLYAFHPDGTLKWQYKTGDDVHISPVIDINGTIYFGSLDDYFYALNSDGTLKWKYLTGGSVSSSPVIGDDGIIYVGSNDNNVYAFHPDGTVIWKCLTSGWVSSYLNLGLNGTLYAGTWDNKLYAIYCSSQNLAQSPWPKYQQNRGNTGMAEPFNMDIGVSEIIIENQMAAGSTNNVQIMINNYGHVFVNNPQIAYKVGNNDPIIETYSGNIDPFSHVNFTFTIPWTAYPEGNHTVKAFTIYENDVKHFNDTISVQVEVTESDLPKPKNAAISLMNNKPRLTWEIYNQSFSVPGKWDILESDSISGGSFCVSSNQDSVCNFELNVKLSVTGFMALEVEEEDPHIIDTDEKDFHWYEGTIGWISESVYGYFLGADSCHGIWEKGMWVNGFWTSAEGTWQAHPQNGSLTGFNIYRNTISQFSMSPENLLTFIPLNSEVQYQYIDNNTASSISYYYYITSVFETGESSPANLEITTSVGSQKTSYKPDDFILQQNYPNPFNPSTTITFDLPSPEHVNLTVFNVQGQKVKTLVNSTCPAGFHQVSWDGKDTLDRDAGSGVYFYLLKTDESTITKRMVLMR